MRGHFSIEWMSQSSQIAGAQTGGPGPGPAPGPGPGPSACGTHSESLPGFYCKIKSESVSKRRAAQSPAARSPAPRSPAPRSPAARSPAPRPPSSHVTEVGFSSETEEEEEEEETSGYESEGGRSLSPAAPSPSSQASPPLGRRPRTAFTAEQIVSLEKSFKRNAYLGTQDKAELCKTLQLSDKQIRNWFQNRRMKLKRTVQDAMAHACHATVASQFMHLPELQAYRPGPYLRYHESPGPYLRYHEGLAAFGPPPGLQYGAALPGGPALDSFYQYGVLPPPGATTPLLGSYATYPQYY